MQRSNAAVSPRKQPAQARSRATVEAILEGAIRVLVRDGFDGANTTRIAEAAGVSVGSLYQYFPSKEAVVAALIERHADELLRVFDALMPRIADLPVRDALPHIVDAAVDAYRIAPELHRVLNEQVPRVGQMAQIERVSQGIAKQLTGYLARHRDEIGSDRDPSLIAMIIEASVETVVHRAVKGPADQLGSALRTELLLLLRNYAAPQGHIQPTN